MRAFLLLLLGCAVWTFSAAQNITHGPVIGAVGPDSARVYIRTSQATALTVEVATDSSFSSLATTLNVLSNAELDSSVIFTLKGLAPNTQHYLRFRISGALDPTLGSFKTFPPVGDRSPVVIAAGSCQETANMNVFLEIPNHNPQLFLHLGDWTYPSYQLPDSEYPENPDFLKLAWRRRYQEINMDEMLRHLPVGYVHDDDDFFEGGATRNHAADTPVPDSLRSICIRGFTEYFPHYPYPDTAEGLYHSYRLGNVEIFHLDVRSTSDRANAIFTQDSATGFWQLITPEPAGRTLLRAKQKQWLKDGLKNSTADWKVLATGAVFNKNLRGYIENSLALQDNSVAVQALSIAGYSPIDLARSFAGEWAGFQQEQQEILDFLEDEGIGDVVVVGGQTHGNAVDDGTNAGLPEINASGLSVADGDRLVWFGVDLLAGFGFPDVQTELWNGGAVNMSHGPNRSTKNGFGKLEFFGNDSARLSVVDEDGLTMGEVVLIHSSKVDTTDTTTARSALTDTPWLELLYPNPTDGRLTVRFAAGFAPTTGDRVRVSDLNGRQVAVFELTPGTPEQVMDLSTLAAGTYTVALLTHYGRYLHKVVVQ